MAKKIHVDFESRSEVDIWKTGAWVYATHPSTEVLCLAYAIDDGPVKIIRYADLFTYPMSDPFEELRSLVTEKDTLFYAHNALFEQLIWKFKLSDRFDIPVVPLKRWRCTAAKALAVGLPKALSEVGAALGTAHKKDLKGKAVMLKVCKPKADGTFYEDPALFAELEAYCAQDVETERDIDTMLPELNPTEQVVWFEDQWINMRGVQVDTKALDRALEIIALETERLNGRIRTLTNNELDGTSRRLAVMGYLKKHFKVDLPDFTKASVEGALLNRDLPPGAVEILRIRQQLGLTSVAKYTALNAALCEDGRLRDTFLYHAANTGRWGGKLVQLQNLPKGSFDSDLGVAMLMGYDYDTLQVMYPNIMELLSSCVRGMFIAAPGHDLIVADYSAIEARVLMWFCGETEATEMFRRGADIYVEMAKRISPSATRQLGKQAVLACGYGMGATKFQATCEGYGLNIDPVLAQQAVDTYRQTYSKVCTMWYSQENAAILAVRSGRPVNCGACKWFTDKGFLWCQLPSGRRLAYHKPEVKAGDNEQPRLTYMATDGVTKQYIRKDTYGGKIIENIIQATARDILAYALLAAEIKGYKPVMHVHDEIVCEVPEGQGGVKEFEKVICTLPKWADGCPITAEAYRGKRYRKG